MGGRAGFVLPLVSPMLCPACETFAIIVAYHSYIGFHAASRGPCYHILGSMPLHVDPVIIYWVPCRVTWTLPYPARRPNDSSGTALWSTQRSVCSCPPAAPRGSHRG